MSCEYCDSDITDDQGHYSLYPEKSGDHEIIFSKSGYESLHIPISSGSQQLDVNITVPGFVSIVTDELPVTEIEKPYHIKIRIKGGHFPYTYQLIKGELPNGLTFNAETGDITGVCTTPGNYHFTIQVVDINNIPIEKSFTLDVSQILELVTEPVLPRATKGTSYGFQIEAVGGFPPYHFSYASTITPPGLNISTDGIIGDLNNNDEVLYLSETFDTKTVPDSFIMNGQYYPYITDDQRLQFGNISDNRTSQIQLNFQSLTEATLKFDFQVSSESGYDYLKIIINNQTIESWSGNESGNYSCELSQGLNTIIWQYSKDSSSAGGKDTAWIDNIMISSTNGSIGSVPTQAGQYTFTVFVTDDRNQTTKKEYFLDIAAPLSVSPSRLDHGIVGNAYTQTISISGGYGDYRAEITPNLFPEGLLFNPETFTISGIPAAPASITFVFEYFDSENRTGKTIFDLVINDPLQIAQSMLPHGFVNQNYSQVIGQTGGYPPFSFHCKDILPPGLSLDTVQGRIVGTPSTEGLMYFNIVVVDSSYPVPQAYTKLMSIRTLMPHEIEKPLQKTPYSYHLLSDPSTKCELSGGSLPSGLTLNTQTGVLSGIPMYCGNFYFIIDAYTDRYTDYYAYSLDVECCDSCYEVSGRVSQEPDVIVTLTGETSYTTTTDENGYYQFNYFANGQYTIHARKPNYWIDPLFHDIIVDNLDKKDIHFTATANKAPLTPVAEMPLHDSNGIALTSTQLQWSCVDLDNMDMMVYDVYFGNTHALDLLVYGISEQSVNIETQLANATGYFWKVIARDSFGAETASPLWQFETVNSDDKYIKIITLELPVTEIDKFYSEKIMAKGGAYPYTFSIQSGELPPGLVIHERYGFISGQLTKTGLYYFTVQVIGSDTGKPGNITEKELHIEVTNELNIITQNQLPRATLGQTYEFSIEAVGGREPYVFQYHPRHEKGYELSSYRRTWNNAKESCENNNGYLVTIDSFDEYNTVKRLAENARRDAWIGLSRDYSGSDWEWVSNEPVTFDYWYDIDSYYKDNCAYLYAYKDYQWYNQNCLTEEYFICEYNVINGLSLESSGKLTGVPNNYRDYTVTVIVTDASGRQDAQDFVLTIDMPLEISNIHQGRLNDGIVQADYSHQLYASGGFGQYYWDIYSGQLPDGLVLNNETGIISGQPINATYRSVVLSVSDESNRTTFKDLTFEISEPLEIQTIALDNAFRDQPYSEIIKLKPLSGISPYQYIIEGDLPEGLSLDQSTGKIEGTPESSGLFNFDIVVTDSSFPEKQSIRKFFQLNVTTEYMIFAASTLQGNKGDSISIDLGVGGGSPPYEWSIFSGYLPGGVNIARDGALKGCLEDIGDYQFTLQVMDASGNIQKKEFTWNVLDNLKIVTQIVPEGDTQSDYGFQLQAKGGLKPYSWRLLTDSGNLPDGITLLETGWIYGRPQGAQPRTFEVEVSDSSIPQQRTTKSYRIEIMDDFYISTMRLENGKRDAPYSDQILAALGTPPYQWKLDSGTLPPGLVLQETVNNAMIEGTPTSEGTFTFVIAATDAGTPVNHYTREFTIEIYAGLRIINDKLSTAQRGILYSDNIEPKGGELPYHYEIADGELPAGLNLNSLIGKISGITNLDTGYSAEFVIKVTDSGNPASVIEKDFTINVTDPVSIETQNIRDALQKMPYIAQLEGKGGYAPYAWSVSSGRLPDGLQLVSNTAQIIGTPKTCGDFNFTVQMVDASLMPITVTQAYQLIVKCCNNYHITGTVSEMPGVVISITNKSHSYTTTTDETGVYTFNHLQSGDYHVQILEQRCWANEPKAHDVILLNQDIGGVDFSARWNQLPLMASNPSPITSSKSVSLNPVLSWTGKDMDTQDLLTYDLYFGVVQHPSLLVSKLSESTFALENLTANTNYYWQVKSKDTKKGLQMAQSGLLQP
ncbi:MAG: hypothetical protein OMM_03079 [Candidatus Magnetoglobus multicellularis str. Araruama]|uniref:C-type lectin domain-containing protein n=1 Tax=Candidatus Magnetoglobus multicellularis str. Araruama TaxID=890399 RepID=A0A1V1P7A2_9BACT|nr:MAG: hypothetical protein OMM_03079 [Candidatus Magnetoglobus multicellularis str. Araruama]